MKSKYYQIAGHNFSLTLSNDNLINALFCYEPFACKEEKDLLFHLIVKDNLNLIEKSESIGYFNDDIASIEVFRIENDGYRFHIGLPNESTSCIIQTDRQFQKAEACLSGNENIQYFGLNNCLMLLFAFASAPLQTILLHASVVVNKQQGYVFLGKSGTGKSTHSRLWLEHIKDSELLNDDNPIIRILEDGSINVYGSPWSGKTPCYRNQSAILGAIVRLVQAPNNRIMKNRPSLAFASLLPSCSSMIWDKTIHDCICNTLTKIIEQVPSFTLECLPDKDAAEVCHNTIST